MWKRLFLAVFILLAFEVGLLLLMFPWLTAWERNVFLNGVGFLRGPLMSPYLRGAVSGLGLLNVFLGIGEAWHFRDRIRDMEARDAENGETFTPAEKI